MCINYILENCNSRFIITTKNIFCSKKEFFDSCKSKVLLIEELLDSKIKNDDEAENYIGLFADLTASNDEESYEIDAENTFTTEILYSLGFEWPIINNNYLNNTLIELNNIDYFEINKK